MARCALVCWTCRVPPNLVPFTIKIGPFTKQRYKMVCPECGEETWGIYHTPDECLQGWNNLQMGKFRESVLSGDER